MSFELPTEKFNAIQHARDSVIRANQAQEEIFRQIIEPYETIWGVSGEMQDITDEEGNVTSEWQSNGSIYSVDQMTEKLNEIGAANLVAMATQHAAMVQTIEALVPGTIHARYHAAAWDYTVDENGVFTATGLKEAWAVKE